MNEMVIGPEKLMKLMGKIQSNEKELVARLEQKRLSEE